MQDLSVQLRRLSARVANEFRVVANAPIGKVTSLSADEFVEQLRAARVIADAERDQSLHQYARILEIICEEVEMPGGIHFGYSELTISLDCPPRNRQEMAIRAIGNEARAEITLDGGINRYSVPLRSFGTLGASETEVAVYRERRFRIPRPLRWIFGRHRSYLGASGPTDVAILFSAAEEFLAHVARRLAVYPK